MQLVRNQGDELRVGGLSFGVAHRIAEEALQGIQISPIPGDFNGVANGPLHSAGGGLEGFRHLGVEDLGDGIGGLAARLESLLDGVCEISLNNKFCGCIYCFISCPYHCWFVGLIPMITKSNFLVKFEGNKHMKKVFSEQIKPKAMAKTNELFEIYSN